jgi:hypothetical protein
MEGQNNTMQPTDNDNTLNEDKAQIEALFGKQFLAQFEEEQQATSDSFFDTQAAQILADIRKNQKKKSKLYAIGSFRQLAIAASFIIFIAATYIFIQSKQQNEIAKVSIEEIPTEEIDNYLVSNDWINELDWENTTLKEALPIEALSNAFIKDSNKNEKN